MNLPTPNAQRPTPKRLASRPRGESGDDCGSAHCFHRVVPKRSPWALGVGRWALRMFVAALALAALPTLPRAQAPASVPKAAARDWIQLFNGKDLKDWTIKFAHHEAGVNLHDTFRVEDGLLKVRYDKWPGFKDEFGHIFYREPFGYYLLAAEYRFVGEQVKPIAAGLEWAIRNNGLMLHSQDPGTIVKDQDFPISIEVQLLGGYGKPRSTANLCTPGTHVEMDGKLITRHCINSKSKTYEGDQWVRVEVLVHGNELIRHMVEGETVLEYTRPQIGGGQVSPVDPAVKVDGTALTGGYISLQAETAPIDFRKVELLNLEGCTDRKASNYRPYFVKSNPAACRFTK